LDQIDVSALADFDYAALGHLHGPQKVGREDVRYSGTPYKYSVSEERHRKADDCHRAEDCRHGSSFRNIN
ncbi:hypothetical protein, partial [Bifidobacterium longum]|uniref:hypothetical protein n=1 Tax=Bifidobacterium longum TaxID=216816 RepID=UPI003CCC488D